MEPRSVDPYWAELDELVTDAIALRAEMSRLHAERAELCARVLTLVDDRVAQRRAARVAHRGPGGDDIPLREAVAEIGAALRVGDRTVHSWLSDGTALVEQYPATLAALREGRIDERHASAIVDGGAALADDGLRVQYEELVLAAAAHETAPRLRDLARIVAERLQPERLDEAQRRAYEGRRVRVFDLDDGLARLVADLPATIARAILDRLTEMARSVPGDTADDEDASDERLLDEIRADILSDLLLSGAPAAHGGDAVAAIRATVQVTLPALTLAGVGDEPTVLAGHGPIDAGTARRLAAAAPGWDRLFVDPGTGEPLAVDRYRPSAELRRYLAARDEGCRWPGCRRAAHRCDADHTVAHADGGDTRPGNLSLLCRRHYRPKHASPWRVRHLGSGALEFTSPTGRVYRTDAPPVARHVPALRRRSPAEARLIVPADRLSETEAAIRAR